MDDPLENEISSYRRFLKTLSSKVAESSSERNDTTTRHVSYTVESSEIEGEGLLWALDYLCQTNNCPQGLAEHICREAFKRASQQSLSRYLAVNNGGTSSASGLDIIHLQKEMETSVLQVCTDWRQQLPSWVKASRSYSPVSVCAIKNTRRKMEDRHVFISDLNALFQLQGYPSQSYYSVFDGHGGTEAAMFCASQLHLNLLREASFSRDPELALKRAYSITDQQFLLKRLRSGTTGVSLLMRGDHCYLAWLGDSQAMLVRSGQAVVLVEPHRPNRQDERNRIEALGGLVTNAFGGVWRVNGSLSVSRAIGDIDLKPFLCSDADASSFQISGTEDYVVLACDGLWDVVQAQDIPSLVYNYLALKPGDHRGVARHLVSKARELGSSDNISCIVVFFRRDIALPVGVELEGFQFVHENGDHEEKSSQPDENEDTATTGSEVARMEQLNLAHGGSEDGSSVDGAGCRFLSQQFCQAFLHMIMHWPVLGLLPGPDPEVLPLGDGAGWGAAAAITTELDSWVVDEEIPHKRSSPGISFSSGSNVSSRTTSGDVTDSAGRRAPPLRLDHHRSARQTCLSPSDWRLVFSSRQSRTGKGICC